MKVGSPLVRLLERQRSFALPLVRLVLLLWVIDTRLLGASHRMAVALKRHPLEVIEAPGVSTVLSSLSLWPPPPWLIEAATPVGVVAGVCAAAGIATRLSLLVTFVFLWLQYGLVLGFFNHAPALPAQVILALAILPGSTGFSVDRLLLRLWRRWRGTHPDESLLDALCPRVPRFGEVGVCFVVGVMYLAAGVAKLRYGAMGWFNGETLQWYLQGGADKVQYWYGAKGTDHFDGYLYMGHDAPLGRWLGSSLWLTAPLSWATLAVEFLVLPLLIMDRWWRVACVVGVAAFHVVIGLTLGPRFTDWLLVEICLAVPFLLTAIVAAWRRRRLLRRDAGTSGAGGT